MTASATAASVIDACQRNALDLLKRNLEPQGILAAGRSAEAEARRYTRIFGRDAAICVLAMCGSGDALLERGALNSLDALASAQAANGQIPKYVDPLTNHADFWYLGCIDATLWWLVAVDHVRSRCGAASRRWEEQVGRAIEWLRAQEHPHFGLLQQNEASDWADIMPRSGYVLYTNALWVEVKRRFALGNAEATLANFNHLFDPFGRESPAYHRARLLRHYAQRGRRDADLYLSFINLGYSGNEGDVFGNLLAILSGAASELRSHAIAQAFAQANAADPYPIRVVLYPLAREHALWRPYMARHQLNHVHQYHNGGIWPFVGGFWVMVLAQLGLRELAWRQLEQLARVNALDDWRFTEWFHGRTLVPMGMAGQSWNAATFLLAHRALERGGRVW